MKAFTPAKAVSRSGITVPSYSTDLPQTTRLRAWLGDKLLDVWFWLRPDVRVQVLPPHPAMKQEEIEEMESYW